VCFRVLSAALAVMATAVVAADTPVTAPLHGGVVTEAAGHAFETVLTRDAIRVFLYTDELAPAMVEKAAGTAKLRLSDGRVVDVALTKREPAAGEPTSYFCPMHPQVVREHPGKCELCGGMTLFVQDHLYGAVDLAGVDLARVGASIRVTGLRGAQKEATFLPAFKTPDAKAGQGTTGK
jgi:hypothetical protein